MRHGGFIILLLLALTSDCRSAETLSQAWQAALAQNQGLAAVRFQVEAAHQDLLAAASERWPTAALRTGYLVRTSEPSFLSSQPDLGIPTLRLPYAQQEAASFSLRATTPLWSGGRIERKMDAAGSRLAASQEASRWEEMQLRILVAELYVGVLHAEQMVQVASQLLQSAQQNAVNTAEQLQKSRATDRDVMASRLAELEASQRLHNSQNSLSQARAAFNRALGRPHQAEVVLERPETPLLPQPLEQLTQYAVANRPDLLEAAQRVAALQNEAEACHAARMPQLNAEFAYGFEQNRYQTPEGIGTAGVYLDLDVIDSGRSRRTCAARFRVSAAQAELRDRQSLAALEILEAWNHRSDAYREELVSTEALALAREHARWVNERATQGLAVGAESLEAEAGLVKAEARMINAHTHRVLSQLRLRLMAGLLVSE